MINTLFLEDSDLLENINIMESILTPSYENLINEAITENEIMISIYEAQQFLIEQDTQIFMALDYRVVNEGVIGKIGNAIREIFRRLKELISKFIKFIRTRIEKRKTGKIKERIDKIKKSKEIRIKESDLEKIINEKEKSKKNELKESAILENSEEFEKNKALLLEIFGDEKYFNFSSINRQKLEDKFNDEEINHLNDWLNRLIEQDTKYKSQIKENPGLIYRLDSKMHDICFEDEYYSYDTFEYEFKLKDKKIKRNDYINGFDKDNKFFDNLEIFMDKQLPNMMNIFKKVDELDKKYERILKSDFNKTVMPEYEQNYYRLLRTISSKIVLLCQIDIRKYTYLENLYSKHIENTMNIERDNKRISHIVVEDYYEL